MFSISPTRYQLGTDPRSTTPSLLAAWPMRSVARWPWRGVLTSLVAALNYRRLTADGAVRCW